MWETIIAGVVLASISSAFFLAYNHPSQFWKAAGQLFGVLAVCWLCLATWAFSLEFAATAIYAAFDDLELREIQAALDPIRPPLILLILALPIAGILFMMLAWVSTLKDGEKHQKGGGEEE